MKFTSVSKQHSHAQLEIGTVLTAVILPPQQMESEETASVRWCVFLSSAKANVGDQHCQHTFRSLPIFKPYTCW